MGKIIVFASGAWVVQVILQDSLEMTHPLLLHASRTSRGEVSQTALGLNSACDVLKCENLGELLKFSEPFSLVIKWG